MIYFDNAATTGTKPISVISAVNTALKKYCINPGRNGYKLSIQAAEKIYKTRAKTAQLFGCDYAENTVFTLNCTQAVNFVLKGVLKQGDHILISNLEHNAVARPVFELSRNYGVEFDIFNAFAEDIKEELKSKVKTNTKMIFCTHASNVCGKILPIKEIGHFAAENEILFGVDAAQSAGVVPISMKDMNIDFLCIAPHKGLYAPMGTGILLAEKEIPKTIIQGGTGTNSTELIQPEQYPERFESGTVNLSGIFGINAGIDFVNKKGITNIFEHERKLCNKLFFYISQMRNIETYAYSADNAPVISFNIKNISANETAEILNGFGIVTRAGLHCAPIAHRSLNTPSGGTVRVSFSAFNNENEVNSLVQAIKSISENKK